MANTFLGIGLKILEGLFEFAPHLEDEATVEVVGQPGSSKKQLYFLGLSAAFALARRIDVQIAGGYLQPPPGMLMIEYDAADHWVRVTLRYRTSMLQTVSVINRLTSIAGGVADSLLGIGGLVTDAFAGGIAKVPGQQPIVAATINSLPVYSGPDCGVVGESFQFVGQLPIATAGLPDSSSDPLAPKLPFAGKTILTPCAMVADPDPSIPGAGGQLIPSPNPKPPGDNRSRGAVVTGGGPTNAVAASLNPFTPLGTDACCINKSMSLVPLVFAALTDPGSYRDEVFTPPTGGPRGF